jgi:hypothetical protein
MWYFVFVDELETPAVPFNHFRVSSLKNPVVSSANSRSPASKMSSLVPAAEVGEPRHAVGVQFFAEEEFQFAVVDGCG